MTLQELIEQSKSIGVELTDEMVQMLVKKAALLKDWNERINLTAITEPEEVYEKHFFDCILPLTKYDVSGKVCDVGTGAGFPGVIWAIVKPELHVTLLEPTGKRCTYLAEVVKELGLKNVDIVNDRAESFVKTARESYDVVTARAVANLPMLSELCVPLLKVNGTFLSMKGEQGATELAEAKRALGTLGVTDSKVVNTELPSGDKRTIILCHKTKKTPAQFPRAYARIKKQPL